ncbi:MAG: hypothetical protein UW38_C0001G1092 [Candidatus Saccharibacteria bacterium GW2011_GWC2_44_17]|nr:MAG: hypothetical protein UW38_C0001G1092 [Candidatus Saccharibacteria bacterium GW2011_GWC2_44_17]OGL34196.1 MAG: hypothetical protein A3E20_04815 [Candidatus Saccharibacteria bacterium RIFCSPHIGHO2_12_FULL_47_16]
MTMPKTAAVMKLLDRGLLPEEMSDQQLAQAVEALREDLPGDPVEYISRMIPLSDRCECGAVHLSIDEPMLTAECLRSLHRLLATPYGDIVRESFRRSDAVKNIRFGWSGIEAHVPEFVRAVDSCDARQMSAVEIDDERLGLIVDAVRRDMPRVLEMVERSVAGVSVMSVSPEPGIIGQQVWKQLIDQLMFVWSTPVRKYLAEWLLRQYGLRGGAVNCCIVMTGRYDSEDAWRRRWMDEQTNQQLTPDC